MQADEAVYRDRAVHTGFEVFQVESSGQDQDQAPRTAREN